MAAWILLFLSIFLSIFLSVALKLIPKLTPTPHKKGGLPPGPATIPIIANLLLHKKSIFEFEHVLRRLFSSFGPILTLRFSSSYPSIFIADRRLAHQALVQNGASFADRPTAVDPELFLTSNQHDISSSAYGPLWRLLRRNITSGILHPSLVKLFSHARRWARDILVENLRAQLGTADDGVVAAVESFQFAMFSLMVFMCFGEKIDEMGIKEIEGLQTFFLLLFTKFNPFAVYPKITKILFRSRWNEILDARRKQEGIFIPLIRARRREKQRSSVFCYVDSLLDIELPEEEGSRKLSEEEMVSLCHEFLAGGTDTTSTALEWIMAELVKHEEIQKKVLEEIEEVAGGDEIKEEDLQRMKYLKAVILEGLRRHPPGHFVLPHMATEDVILDGFLVPKGAEVHFAVADLNWDGKVWEEPMEFKPERFIDGGEGEGVDITGSREIKMMTFGAGRRICPGFGLAMLHLEYLVGNLVREFEWKKVDGEEVDLSEKLEFTTVMKNRLRAWIIPRRNTRN